MRNSLFAFSRVCSRSLFLAVIGLAPVPAVAGETANLCADVKRLVGEARLNFANRTTATQSSTPALSGAEACGLTRSLSGPKSYHCRWAFPYRAAEAHSRFEAVKRSLQECFGAHAPANQDQRVNHPDFYDLQQYHVGEVEVSVSIKDKGALQKTYLFLRVQGARRD